MKEITLREGYKLIFHENKHKIDIVGLEYSDTLILEGWMEIVDFIAVLESALRNKLGTKKKCKVGKILTVYGSYQNEFLVKIEMEFLEEVLVYNLVEIQQFVSKLNKLVHTANKLYIKQSVVSDH